MTDSLIPDTQRTLPLPAVEHYHQAISLLCNELAELYFPQAAEALIHSALERESLEPTYVGRGLAIPHARVEGLPHAAIYTAKAPEGIDWNGNTATTITLLGVPSDQPELYLRMMSQVVRRYKA